MAWITGNFYLTQAQMENNAPIVWQYLGANGWTINAVAGILGNMQTESNINPGLWESLQEYNYDGGFGLTQWTPATKYIEWAGGDESVWNNGEKELERILYEVQNNLQWFQNPAAPIPNPPITFAEYTQSTESPETLANYFLWYYEHPADINQPQRATQAAYWYTFLGGIPLHKLPKAILYYTKWWLADSYQINMRW